MRRSLAPSALVKRCETSPDTSKENNHLSTGSFQAAKRPRLVEASDSPVFPLAEKSVNTAYKCPVAHFTTSKGRPATLGPRKTLSLSGLSLCQLGRQTVPAKPDTDTSGCPVVLYTPDASTECATKTCEVALDGFLSERMRPHQQQGIRFLFGCMGVGKEKQDRTDHAAQQQQQQQTNMQSQAQEQSQQTQQASLCAEPTVERPADQAPCRPRFYGAILADDMGLGKTAQAISILWTLLTNGIYGKPSCQRALVLCPSSLVQNWEAEIEKWLGKRLPATVLDDTRAQVVKDKLAKFCSSFADSRRPQLLIMSYTTYRIHAALVMKKNIDLLICDEAHQLKNGESQIAKAVMELPAQRRLLLSGTPIQNDLMEFYTMVHITNPDFLGDLATFRKRFQNPILRGRDAGASDAEVELGAARSEELVKQVNQFMLRRTNTILQELLPPRVEQVVFCRMSALQTQLYQHFLASAPVQAALDSSQPASKGTALRLSTLPAINALQKLCCHPDLVSELCSKPANPGPSNNGRRAVLTGFENGLQVFSRPSVYPAYQPGGCQSAHAGKAMVLESILKAVRNGEQDASNKDKVVVVSNYTEALDILQKMCGNNGWPTLRIDGSNSVKQRQPLVNKFNDPAHESFVFLLSSKAAGMGLNIIGANRLVMFDCDWNPANDAQAMARVWREGQQKNVFIYRLLTTGSIEEKIFQRQIAKVGLSKVVMEDGTSTVPQFSRDELRALFKIQQDTVCDTHSAIRCTCDGASGGAPGSRDESEGLMAWAHLQNASAAADPVWQRMSPWICEKYVTFLFSDHTVRRKQKPGSPANTSQIMHGDIDGDCDAHQPCCHDDAQPARTKLQDDQSGDAQVAVESSSHRQPNNASTPPGCQPAAAGKPTPWKAAIPTAKRHSDEPSAKWAGAAINRQPSQKRGAKPCHSVPATTRGLRSQSTAHKPAKSVPAPRPARSNHTTAAKPAVSTMPASEAVDSLSAADQDPMLDEPFYDDIFDDLQDACHG